MLQHQHAGGPPEQQPQQMPPRQFYQQPLHPSLPQLHLQQQVHPQQHQQMPQHTAQHPHQHPHSQQMQRLAEAQADSGGAFVRDSNSGNNSDAPMLQASSLLVCACVRVSFCLMACSAQTQATSLIVSTG